MIIRRLAETDLFITQPDHAHLAERVMRWCVALSDHPRRLSVLRAVREHDNGWAEPDAAPLIDPATGEPFDFIHVPAEVRQDVWPRGITRLVDDPWSAALVAQHAVVVYDRYRGDPAWHRFFPAMEAQRDALVQASGGRIEDLVADYRLVRLGDLISLMFCTGWTEPQQFEEWTITRADDDVVIHPNPFGGEVLAIDVPARQLPHRTYRSDEELRQALSTAASTVHRGTVR